MYKNLSYIHFLRSGNKLQYFDFLYYFFLQVMAEPEASDYYCFFFVIWNTGLTSGCIEVILMYICIEMEERIYNEYKKLE